MSDRLQAIQDFRRIRLQADMEVILARIKGVSPSLLSFDEVRQKLNVPISGKQEIKEIPLDAIIGSVGRYTDFTRRFLPKKDSDEFRWSGVMQATYGELGLPPIEVYQIDKVYFVKDGNHRVSVARKLEMTTIQAYVTVLLSKVPVTPEIQPDDLILKAEYADFLENTQLDRIRPNEDFTLTAPGQYNILMEHISVHRYFMGIDQKREVTYEEAVAHWFDKVYFPVVQAIRERGILRSFPHRTEADLYLWVSAHHAELRQVIGMDMHPTTALIDLAERRSNLPSRVFTRVAKLIMDILTPDELEAGPYTGQWRKELVSARSEDCLFLDILVPISGQPGGWFALEQALEVAKRENASLHGLHILPAQKQLTEDMVSNIQNRFEARCIQSGIPGEMISTRGEIARLICSRARWTDLIVVNISYPPTPNRISRLGSGFRTIIRRCSRPILAVPTPKQENISIVSSMQHALLAYGGSQKSEEALYIAAYLASRWGLTLDVLTVGRGNGVILLPEGSLTGIKSVNGLPLPLSEHAKAYLDGCNVSANFISAQGSPSEQIIRIAEERNCDLIIMGGYEATPFLEIFLSSTVDGVLRKAKIPVLICR